MPISLYDAVIPTMIQITQALRNVLDKVEAFAAEKGLTEAELLGARLIDDMFPLNKQIACTVLNSSYAIESTRKGEFLLDPTAPPPADMTEMKAALDDVVAALKAVTPEEMEAMIGRNLHYSIPAFGLEMDYAAEDFLLSYVQPNFFFHITTAYDILRGLGVSIGKRDFLGQLRIKTAA
ncbi:MAG: DUF1993 domain-containing protein [Sphingomonadales bacterium]|nr:MAG: DUF1993 domain-containing protein [Sphingomonadales bacterium]TNF05358.1 MAG: DUF1993 domain-containing protein [Sphingomonadales bacterium]